MKQAQFSNRELVKLCMVSKKTARFETGPFSFRLRILTLQQLQHLLWPGVGLGQYGQARLLENLGSG